MMLMAHINQLPQNGVVTIVCHAVPTDLMDILSLPGIGGDKNRFLVPMSGFGQPEESPDGIGTMNYLSMLDYIPDTLAAGTVVPTLPPLSEPSVELTEDYFFVESYADRSLFPADAPFYQADYILCTTFVVVYATAAAYCGAGTRLRPSEYYPPEPLTGDDTLHIPDEDVIPYLGATIEIASRLFNYPVGSYMYLMPMHPNPSPTPSYHFNRLGARLVVAVNGIDVGLMSNPYDEIAASTYGEYPGNVILGAHGMRHVNNPGIAQILWDTAQMPGHDGGFVVPGRPVYIQRWRPRKGHGGSAGSLLTIGLGGLVTMYLRRNKRRH